MSVFERRFDLELRPALIAFVLSTFALCLAANATGGDFWLASEWGRDDTAIYLQIAHQGYNILHCPTPNGQTNALWCGTAGWLPGYPLLLAPLFSLGLPSSTAVVVAWLFDFALLLLVWNGFLRHVRSPS